MSPWYPPATDLVFGIGETPPKTKWDKIGADLDYLYGGRIIAGLYGSTSAIPYATWTTISYDNAQVSTGGVTVGGTGFTVPAGNYFVVANGYPPSTELWQTRILAGGVAFAADGSGGGLGYSVSGIQHVNLSTVFTTEAFLSSGGVGDDLVAFSGLPNFAIFQMNG